MEELLIELEALTPAALKAELDDAGAKYAKKETVKQLAKTVAAVRAGGEYAKVDDKPEATVLPFQEKADSLFKQYENLDTFYICKDGNAFFTEPMAVSHGTGYDVYERE